MIHHVMHCHLPPQLMDKVYAVIHIEPLAEAVRDFKELRHSRSLGGKIDAITGILNHRFDTDPKNGPGLKNRPGCPGGRTIVKGSLQPLFIHYPPSLISSVVFHYSSPQPSDSRYSLIDCTFAVDPSSIGSNTTATRLIRFSTFD
ncbi:unnamed protein product [Haemonchus placei]|uniref:S ribonuclease n=1 Tax=Haemonchus placei TaxID=6290 RepID=A0A0N4WA20_HAEPC|nr:unnamed protein product [Haemonchus placei]